MPTRSRTRARQGTPAERPATVEKLARRNRTNLAELAYDRLEELIITCVLRPGLLLSIQDLQDRTGLGRTPIHQAVSRLAADTLIIIRPRHGLQIAPIDLARGRTLTQLRRDMERFVVRLASERCGASHRNEMLHIAGVLRERGSAISIDEFNRLDRRIDRLLIAAAGEPFLENTLRPLHTIFRRTGWIYHSWVRPDEGLRRTVECHLAILEAVADERAGDAVAAADQLVSFSDSMFDVLGRGTDPTLFDCNLEMLSAG